MLLAESLLLPDLDSAGSPAQVCQNTGSALHAVSHFDLHVAAGVQQNVDPRTKLDQSHSLSAFHPIAYFFVEDDPARQQSCDLLEDYRLPVSFDGDRILLVVLGRGRVHGV